MRYDPRAVPTFGDVSVGVPAYVARKELERLALVPGWRRVWRLGGTVLAVEDGQGTIVRSYEEWGGIEPCRKAAQWWVARGLRATSPGGLLLQAARDWFRPLAWSRHGFARPALRGGWQETQVKGIIRGPHKVLDLRKAYRWALTAEPFPDRRSLRIARRYDPDLPGLHLVDCDQWPTAPWPLREGGPQLVETPVDVHRFGPAPVRAWRGGVTWDRTIPATGLAAVLDEIDVAALHRCFWGLWVADTPTRCDFRSGAVTYLRPYGTDYVRAHLILQRVRRRVAEIDARYRYVDSVIVPAAQDVPTGEAVGDWREVRRYDNGVWIGWPGAYGPADGRPEKLAGIKREVA